MGVVRAHLTFAGFDDARAATVFKHYHAPAGFVPELAKAFAGIEIIRRLLGVAQLPMQCDAAQRLAWLEQARS